jgi:hypothetical protein
MPRIEAENHARPDKSNIRDPPGKQGLANRQKSAFRLIKILSIQGKSVFENEIRNTF